MITSWMHVYTSLLWRCRLRGLKVMGSRCYGDKGMTSRAGESRLSPPVQWGIAAGPSITCQSNLDRNKKKPLINFCQKREGHITYHIFIKEKGIMINNRWKWVMSLRKEKNIWIFDDFAFNFIALRLPKVDV